MAGELLSLAAAFVFVVAAVIGTGRKPLLGFILILFGAALLAIGAAQ